MQFFNYLAPQGKKQFLANLLDYSGVNSLLNSFTSWSGLLVLNYHRIGTRKNTSLDRNLFSATAEELERQIVMFQQHADIIGIQDLAEIHRSRRGKYILLTFDDGYRDNYELAFPVLKDCRAKATFFIPSGFIDSPRVAWWDEIAWYKTQKSPRCPPAPDGHSRFPFLRNILRKLLVSSSKLTGRYRMKRPPLFWRNWRK